MAVSPESAYRVPAAGPVPRPEIRRQHPRPAAWRRSDHGGSSVVAANPVQESEMAYIVLVEDNKDVAKVLVKRCGLKTIAAS